MDKICRRCNRHLDIDSFHKSKIKSYIDGRVSICRECIKRKVVVRDKPTYNVNVGEYLIRFD